MRDRPLAELPGGPDTLVLCATAALAQDLRRSHGELMRQRGETTWLALETATLPQWLDHLVSAALLRDEISTQGAPRVCLTRPQEHALWTQAIGQSEQGDVSQNLAELLDRDGLAVAAMEADRLVTLWAGRLEVVAEERSLEYRSFLAWRASVAARCREQGWATALGAQLWRLGCLEGGAGRLPTWIGLAGFIERDPLLEKVLAALAERGVTPFRLDFSRHGSAGKSNSGVLACEDAADEYAAAAGWARAFLDRQPGARLRIAVADLSVRRRGLVNALDATLHPECLGAAHAESERRFVVSASTRLADEAPVELALSLLALAAHPQRLALADFGRLLCQSGWSADRDEADARAQLDFWLRDNMPVACSLERLLRVVRRQAESLPITRLVEHLDALVEAVRRLGRRQMPGGWGREFVTVLAALGWPGQRAGLPRERLACRQFTELLHGMATLDLVVGRIDAGQALRDLRRLCRERTFSAPRTSAPEVEVCELDGAMAGPVDGLWLMGMNEGVWPPPARPNPLLPAEWQRRAGIAQSRSDRLAEQAAALAEVWRASAAEVVFSWRRNEGERALMPSPLLHGLSALRREEVVMTAVAASAQPRVRLERLHDARAPAVASGERVRGGTALLQAQALCPAWGFYRYRLGAKALPVPEPGLDARARGSLVHGALELLWCGRSSAEVASMDAPQRANLIRNAVAQALDRYDAEAVEPLPPRFRALESGRMQALLHGWLALELTRPAFRVQACEEAHVLDIEGLPVRVVVDRIDVLDDGRWVILDYKTGGSAKADSWAETRIREPQLPIYAALAFPDADLAGVALARVVIGEPGFSGVAADDEVLPDVKSLAGQRRRYAEAEFPDWRALRDLWGERLRELAREVRDGCAAVVLTDEKTLKYCEVLPILRLAERRALWTVTEGEACAGALK